MKKFTLTLLVVLMTGMQALHAQNIRVTGTVRDADGAPLLGASVSVAGQASRGTITGTDGTYALEVSSNGALDFTFIGMVPVQIPVNGRTVINVQLESDSQMIDDVIVVAYGTARRSSFTGSVGSVDGDALKNTRAETIDKALVGKTSGIRVSQITGDPGSAGEIQVRGIGSITGSTTPLYVVDGVPISTGSTGGTRGANTLLTSINTSDIESISVLKDAAAASLYGSRAANGVVLITTKKGTEGKARVNFSASVGWSEMATNSYDVMNGEELHDYFTDIINNSLADGVAAPAGFSAANYPGMTASEYIALPAQDGEWGIARKNGQNWRDYLYGNTGMDQNYQASVSGGSQTSRYYLGLSYQDMEGIVTGTAMKRYSFLLNNSTDVTKWLTLEGKAQLSLAQTRGNRDSYSGFGTGGGMSTFGPAGLVFQSNPSQPLHNPDGSYNEYVAIPGNFLTPAYEMGRQWKFFDNDNARALIGANAEVRFTDYLKFRTTNGIDFVDVLLKEYWGPTTGDGRSLNGMGQKDLYRNITINSSNILQFSKSFNELHNVDVMGGYEVSRYSSDFTTAAVDTYSTDKLPALSVGLPSRAGGSLTEWLLGSWLMNATYNYDQKYYLGANIRSDTSSRLAADNRQGTFWSVSGAWRFSRESFLLNNPVLTDAKVRASYGTNGSLPTGSYGYMALYYFGGYYGGDSAIFPESPANPNLGWEKSRNLNMGIDFTLFNRFTFSAEYYNKYTTDLLMSVPISYATGFSSIQQNNGELSNKGFDFEFRGNNILNSGTFVWDSSIMLGTLKAVVEKLPDGNPVMSAFTGDFYRYEEGKDLYSMYLPTWLGVNPQTGKGEFLIDPTKPESAGNITTNHAEAKRSVVAKAYPDFNGAWNNTFTWKGLSLNVLLTYQFGGNIYDYWGYFAHSDGRRVASGWNQAKDLVGNYWKNPGDVVDNPRPVTYSQTSDLASSRWVKSSDFIRLKEISLTYTLPSKWTQQWGIGDVNLSVAANNVAYLYAATKDIELETPLNGFRSPDTPLSRAITVGVSVNF